MSIAVHLHYRRDDLTRKLAGAGLFRMGRLAARIMHRPERTVGREWRERMRRRVILSLFGALGPTVAMLGSSTQAQ